MYKINLKNKIYTSYSSETDMTTIFEDKFSNDGSVASTEVKGFYFGKPTEELTKQFYGKIKAEYYNHSR